MGLLYPEEKSKSSLFLRLSARQELSFCKNFYEGRDYHELDSETRQAGDERRSHPDGERIVSGGEDEGFEYARNDAPGDECDNEARVE